VKLTEFWERMELHLGPAYAHVWASEHRLGALDHRSVDQALADGDSYKSIWRAVWSDLELPLSER
jgi:hypothetical protein